MAFSHSGRHPFPFPVSRHLLSFEDLIFELELENHQSLFFEFRLSSRRLFRLSLIVPTA
jgi:hypothetical protein